MPYLLKLHIHSPILRRYFHNLFQPRCLSWILDGLQLLSCFDLDRCHDVHDPPSSPI